MNMSAAVQVRTALDHEEGSADRNGAEFDMQGFDGVMMVIKFGDIAVGAVTSIKAQQDTVTGMEDAADLLGSGQTVEADDDNQIFIIDLYRPRKQFVRLVVDKDEANITEEMAIYIGYDAKQRPTVLTLADKVSYELHVSPAEGTA